MVPEQLEAYTAVDDCVSTAEDIRGERYLPEKRRSRGNTSRRTDIQARVVCVRDAAPTEACEIENGTEPGQKLNGA